MGNKAKNNRKKKDKKFKIKKLKKEKRIKKFYKFYLKKKTQVGTLKRLLRHLTTGPLN
jgi:hypothetical protein